MAQIEIEGLKVILQHVRFVDRENKDDTKTSLLELKMTTRVSAEWLAELHPSLRSTFYVKPDPVQGEIVEGGLSKLKFGEAIKVIKWEEKLDGAIVEIDHGIGSKLNVDLATVGPFSVALMDGGTCQLSFPIRAEFSSKDVKTISELIKAEVTVTAAMAQGALPIGGEE